MVRTNPQNRLDRGLLKKTQKYERQLVIQSLYVLHTTTIVAACADLGQMNFVLASIFEEDSNRRMYFLVKIGAEFACPFINVY